MNKMSLLVSSAFCFFSLFYTSVIAAQRWNLEQIQADLWVCCELGSLCVQGNKADGSQAYWSPLEPACGGDSLALTSPWGVSDMHLFAPVPLWNDLGRSYQLPHPDPTLSPDPIVIPVDNTAFVAAPRGSQTHKRQLSSAHGYVDSELNCLCSNPGVTSY